MAVILLAVIVFGVERTASAQTIQTTPESALTTSPALAAGFNQLSNIASDTVGNSYIATQGQIFQVTPAGQILVVAANGVGTTGVTGEGDRRLTPPLESGERGT